MPANMPEPDESLDVTPIEEPTAESEQTPEQEQPAESMQSPETADTTEAPADPDVDADVSPSVEPGETMPSTEPGTEQEGEPGESPTPTASNNDEVVGPVERTISSTASDNAFVEITGLLPEGAKVSVTSVDPTEVDLNGQEVLAAYDITILDKDGYEYKITDPVTVTISGISILQDVPASIVHVYHIEDGSTEPQRVSIVSVDGDSVTFTADSFSIYAVTVNATSQLADDGENAISKISDSGICINTQAESWTVEITADGEPFDPNKKYSRGTVFKFNLSYTFDNNTRPDIDNTVAYFELPKLPDGESLFDFMSDLTGQIVVTLENTSKVIGGTYEIRDGKVWFYYTNKDWLEDNNGNMQGEFTFEAKISEEASENKSEVEVVFPGKPDETTITFEDGKVNGHKSGDFIEGTNQIEYTVRLEVNDTDITNVTLKDVLKNDGLTFVSDSFTLDGTKLTDIEGVTINISGKECNITIPKLKIGTYYLKYRVQISDDAELEAADNTVTWDWKENDGEKGSDDSHVTFQKHGLEKTSWQDGNRIWWVIKVTPDQLTSIAGTTITDTLVSEGLQYEGTFNIYEELYGWYYDDSLIAKDVKIPNASSGSFEYTFEDHKDTLAGDYEYKTGKAYYVVYSTIVLNDSEEATYTNSVTVGDDTKNKDQQFIPKKEELQSDNIVTKTGTVMELEGDEEDPKIRWTIEIDFSKYEDTDIIENLTLTDTNDNPSYNIFDFDRNSITVEDEYGKSVPYILETWSETSFTIKFTDTFNNKSPKIIVSYTSSIKKDVEKFTGSRWIANNVKSTYVVNGELRGEPDSASVEYKRGSTNSQLSKTGEINGLEVEWTIEANRQSLYGAQWGVTVLSGDYVIQDELPEGMKYMEGTAEYVISGPCDVGTVFKYTQIEPEINGRTLTFTFKGLEDAGDWDMHFIILKYKTQITDVEKGDPIGDGSYSFVNHASFTGEGVSEAAEGNVTYTKKILDKYGALSNDKNAIDRVDYTILVNVEEDDLIDGDWLTLVDTLDPNTTLILDSLHVKDYATGTEVPHKLSYDSSDGQGKFILTIPDEQALLVTYGVTVIGDMGQEVIISNSAELRGVTGSGTTTENRVVIQNVSASIRGEKKSISLKKIDSNDINTPLAGAKFALYRQNADGSFSDEPVAIKETDASGKLTFGVSPKEGEQNEGLLDPDTLYYYVEVEAPSGYVLDETECYFMIQGEKFEENWAKLSDEYKKKTIVYQGGNTILVSNEANPTYGFFVEKTDEDEKPLDGAEFTLKQGDNEIVKTTENGTIHFDELAPGEYTLTETKAPDGYKKIIETYTIIIGEDGNITYKKGNVTLSDLSGEGPLVIKNEKITGSAEFFVEKTYENWNDEIFKFELKTVSRNGSDYGPMPETAVAYSQYLDVKSSIRTTFGKIEFDTNGDYYYTIKEVKGDDSGIRYDVTRYYIRVHVADNKEENPTEKIITIYVTTDEKEWDSTDTPLTEGEYTAKFTNVPTAGNLKVTKTISGVTVDETWVQENGSKIEFTVYGPAADGNKGPERAKFNYAQMNSDENGIISKFIQDLPVGEYTVEETYTGFDNYSITTTYQVTENGTVIVGSGKDGVAKGNVTDQGTLEIDFTNEYTLLTGSLTVNKTITGLDLTKLTSEQMEAIKFVVMTDPEDEETIVGEPFTLDKFKDLGNGKYQYMLPNDLPYGTYYVKEIGGAMSGYTHIVTVNGETASSGSVTIGDGNTTPEVSVVNIYRKHGELTVTKTFDGDALTETQENQIKFTVYGPASNESNGPKIAEFTYADIVVAGGSMTFTNLAEGTYTVVESNQEIGGYTVTTEYSVGESAAEQNATYTVEIHDQDKIQVDFVNTYRRTTTGLEVTKIWNDSENQDGIRPQTIDVVLISSIDGESWSDVEQTEDIKNPITLPDDGDVWSYTWSKLPTHDVNGNPIKYSVREELPENSGYAGAVSLTGNAKEGYKVEITNTHETEKTNVKVVKNWNKNGYENLQLPESITVTLYAQVEGGAKETKPEWTVTLPEDGKWEHTFENLPVYEDGKKITYTVSEVEIDQYDSTTSVAGPDVDGNYTITITNTYNPELIDIPVEKVWDDEDNQDGIRPTEITVELLADNDPTGETIKLGNGNWSGIFENLRKYGDDGHEIQYTVKELEIQLPDGYTGAGYSSSVSKDSTGKITITNTHTLATTKVEGKKTWDDDNDRDHQRPTEIEIKLVAKIDGTTIEDLCQTKKLSKTGNEWEYSFDGLPVYRDGKKITYEVIEVSVNEGYTLTQIGDEKNSYELINKHTPGETSVSVVKNWDDANDQDDVRPDSIWVKLYKKVAGGDWKEVTASTSIPNPVELSGNNWSYTWTGLPEKEDGQTIEYWVKETTVPTYYTSDEEKDTVKEGNVITITNHHKPEETSVDVEKKWENGGYTNINIQYPDSVYVRLYAQTADDQEPWTKDEWRVELSKTANDWKHTFSNLPVRKNGKLITYTIVEETVDGPYAKPSINGSATAGFTVTNTYAPQTTEVDVTKVWEDNNDQDGIRPSSIRVQLKANGSDYGQSVELNSDNGWYYQWTNLPTVDGKGDKIDYTVEETGVPSGYTSRTTGGWDADTNSYKYTITNTYTPQQTSVKVVKAWDDVNNQDGKRPASITVQLYADGVAKDDSVTLNSENGWTYTWTDLPMNADGEQIDYTVVESGVPDGYTTSDPAGGFNAQTNQYEFTITNTHTPAVTDIEVIKNWIDDDDNDGLRPTSIKVQLKADGTVVREQLELKADSWSGKWENLPVYRNNGTRIIYTVEEVTVPGYSVEYDGGSFDEETGTYTVFTVTNTHEAGTTNVSVKKIWEDGNNQDGKRPTSITVQLYAGTVAQGDPITLNSANGWTYTWNNLPAKAGGQDIRYTVKEVTVPDGYSVEYAGGYNEATHTYELITITNVHTLETVNVSGTKTWNHGSNTDPNNQPDSITIRLYKETQSGGKQLVKTQEVKAPWSWNFTGLPKYENGEPITYSVEEDKVAGYTSDVDGYNVINTYDEQEETPSPTPGETSAPTETPVPTETPAPGETPVPTETPAPGETPVPSEAPTPVVTPVPEETPGPEEPEPTPDEDATPAPTGTPVVAPTATPTPELLQPRRYQISGTEGMVLGARRGMDYAVLGMRRRPSTGDSVAMLWWLLSLFTALGGCITSGVMMMFGRKRE